MVSLWIQNPSCADRVNECVWLGDDWNSVLSEKVHDLVNVFGPKGDFAPGRPRIQRQSMHGLRCLDRREAQRERLEPQLYVNGLSVFRGSERLFESEVLAIEAGNAFRITNVDVNDGIAKGEGDEVLDHESAFL